MNYIQLPTTSDPRQILHIPVSPDGHAFQAQVELRWLPAPARWFLSISDAMTGETFVNQIPLICSHAVLNDLLFPFRWLFQGSGLGSLFCLKAVDSPQTQDPSETNLHEFRILWGDRWKEA